MKRLLAGGCALGFVGAGLVAFASPGSAGDPPEPSELEFIDLEAKATPAELNVGDSFTISSVDVCSDSTELYWEMDSITTGEKYWEYIPLATGESWELPFEADIAEELQFYAECLPEGYEDRDEYCLGDTTPDQPGEEAKSLSAATEEEEETEEPTTTIPETSTTETTIVEPPFDCTYETYWLELKVGDPAPPAPGTPKPIPGRPPYTG